MTTVGGGRAETVHGHRVGRHRFIANYVALQICKETIVDLVIATSIDLVIIASGLDSFDAAIDMFC